MVIRPLRRQPRKAARRVARIVAALVAVTVVGAACASSSEGNSESPDPTEAGDQDDGDTFVRTTDEAGEPIETPTTESDTPSSMDESDRPSPTSVTTIEQTTETPDAGLPVSIIQIDFDAGTFTIANHGTDDVDLGEIWICEFPDYETIEAQTLAAGDSVTIPNPHGSSAEDGELALYRSDDFEDFNAILSYVEWGAFGHTRSSVAVQADLWGSDAVEPGLLLATNGAFAIDATGWSVLTTLTGEARPPLPTSESDDPSTPSSPGSSSPAEPPPDDYSSPPPAPSESTPAAPPPPDDYSAPPPAPSESTPAAPPPPDEY